MKLRSKRFCRSSTFKFGISFVSSCNNKIKVADDRHKNAASTAALTEIKWELRPGGMLVQRREIAGRSTLAGDEETITIRVSTVSQFHDISVQPTSTFGKFLPFQFHFQIQITSNGFFYFTIFLLKKSKLFANKISNLGALY